MRLFSEKPDVKRRGYNQMELIIALAILALTAALVFPRGTNTKDRLTAEMAAKQLVTRLRQVRQAAISKNVPSALGIPKTATTNYSDSAFILEGEINPRAVENWKVEQDGKRVVYFVGGWNGPNWVDLPGTFNVNDWWDANGQRPSAHIFAFTPHGDMASSAKGADGTCRILVSDGVTENNGQLQGARNAWTVWLAPSGEVGLEQGVMGATQNYESKFSDTPDGAPLALPGLAQNRAPRLTSLKALPDVQNPNAAEGKLLDATSCLTLELRFQDDDGDPPFFQWTTKEALDKDGNSRDEEKFGGKFGNSTDCRMEWSKENKEWVGRVSWTPATDDKGGCSYKLQCKIVDRHGGETFCQFPVQGYLKTTHDPWILYKTLNKNNHWELWKMTLLGREHQRVAAFATEDVTFGQYCPAGDEVVVATNLAVYRVKADGSGLRRVATPPSFPIGSVCVTPNGDALYYICGASDHKDLRRVALNAAGAEAENILMQNNAIDQLYSVTCGKFGGSVLLIVNFYRQHSVAIGPPKKRSGIVVFDVTVPTQAGLRISKTDPAPGTLKDAGQHGLITGGATLTEENDEVLWGYNGDIEIRAATYGGSPDSFAVNPKQTINVGLADVHHPKYTWDRKGLVFANGRGTAARIWCLPDLTAPGSLYEVPLPPDNLCADEPSIGPPY